MRAARQTVTRHNRTHMLSGMNQLITTKVLQSFSIRSGQVTVEVSASFGLGMGHCSNRGRMYTQHPN
eukprot:286474-Amorphochlora_amoeboformis.AAC.1